MFERMDPSNMDPDVAAHVGSCMTCFRVLTELRDAPRLAAILRADPPVLPAEGDRFWDDLAARTTDAVLAVGSGEQSSPALTRSPVRWRRPGRIAAVASVVAMAAAVVLMVGRGPSQPVATSGSQPAAVTELARAVSEDEAADEADAVAELDGTALRRLLERLQDGAPGELTALAGSEPEALFDEEIGLDDEIVDLDGPALLRLERSLEGKL